MARQAVGGAIASLPRRMRAVVIRDQQLVVQERPDPEPGAGQVLVRIHAAGLNGADMHQRLGRYPAPPGSPQDIPGLELAGEVVRCGPDAERFNPGDRVMAVVGGGGQAEMAVVHERMLMPVPENLSWAEAGGVPEVFTTAHDMLFTQAGLEAGEHLLVHGAAGGVGTTAVQLGRATGARVTASVRGEALRDQVAELGASVIAPEGFGEHGPFDVILELVGAPNLQENLLSLAPRGRLAVIGIGAGAKAELNLGLLLGKRLRILGSTLRPRPLEEKALAARAMERSVLPLLASGAVKVPIAATYPLAEVEQAYERFTEGGKLGKIVLEV
jgi:NADPH:quinone reductase